MPNSWRLVISFLTLALREKISPSVELFNLFFAFAFQPGKNSWYYFQGREGKPLVSNPVSSIKEWKNKFVFVKVEGLKRSWNFDYVAPALKLNTTAKNCKAEVRKLEALGIVTASPDLLSNESMTRAGVLDHGRKFCPFVCIAYNCLPEMLTLFVYFGQETCLQAEANRG